MKFEYKPQGRSTGDRKLVFPRKKLSFLLDGVSKSNVQGRSITNYLNRMKASNLVDILTNVDFGNAAVPKNATANFSGKNGNNIAVSTFFKVYANLALGMNMFEHTIPKISNISPVGDYEQPEQGSLPEERNYQEDLRGNLKSILEKFKDSRGESDVSHLLKYFFDRKRVKELEDPTYFHFDSAGRQDLIRFREDKDALLSKDSVDLEENIFFPFRMEDPIDRNSLRAAEILTSVNETFSSADEFFDYFKYGFCFDNIVAVPYKMDDFVINNEARLFFDDKEYQIPENVNVDASGRFTNFDTLKKSLYYLNSTTGRVKKSVLYPLTIRARIKKVGEL